MSYSFPEKHPEPLQPEYGGVSYIDNNNTPPVI